MSPPLRSRLASLASRGARNPAPRFVRGGFRGTAIWVTLSLLLLAGSASALEVSTDASKISSTTVSYGGASFTLFQGYYTVTVTNNGAAVPGWGARGTALGEQVTSVETTNSTGKAVLPIVTDLPLSLVHIQIRSCDSCIWEEHGPPPITDPAPPPPGAAPAAAGGAAAGGGGEPALPQPPGPRDNPSVLLPSGGSGLASGGLFNAFTRNADWLPPGAPAAAAVPEAAPAGIGLAQALLLDALMVGGAVGYAMRVRVRPRAR
ncbi:MAG: hypothetical protein QXO51_03140 [Halobacteria archaeon]